MNAAMNAALMSTFTYVSSVENCLWCARRTMRWTFASIANEKNKSKLEKRIRKPTDLKKTPVPLIGEESKVKGQKSESKLEKRIRKPTDRKQTLVRLVDNKSESSKVVQCRLLWILCFSVLLPMLLHFKTACGAHGERCDERLHQ